MTFPMTITESAAGRLKEILAEGPEDTVALRLVVTTTGCSGNGYDIQFVSNDDDVKNSDCIEAHGIKLYIYRMHSIYFFNTEIDFVEDDLGNTRLVFNNPNESGRCGCGESISFDLEELQDRDITLQPR